MAWAATTGAHATAVGTTSASAALGAAPASADRIVASVITWKNGSAPSTPTVSDNVNAGNYTEDSFQTNTDGSFQMRGSVFSMANVSASTPTITVSATGNGGCGFAAQSYSGLSTSSGASGIDKSAASSSGGTTSNTPSSGATAATTAANELVIGAYGDDGYGATQTAGTGFTQRDTTSGFTVDVAIEDKDSGGSGTTQTATTTISSSTNWTENCVVYKLAGGGGGATAVVPPMRTLRGAGV